MLYTYVSITYSYFQGILYSFYFINCMEVTVHTPLSREVFWHEYAKIPIHTSQNSFQIACGNGILACMSRDFGIFMPKHLAG